MTIFTENIFVWMIVAFALVFTGYAIAKGTNKIAWLWSGVGAGALAIVLGVVFVYFVQTDAKRVRRTITELSLAVRSNDVDKVCSFVAKSAERTKRNARVSMAMATIDATKITSYKLEELNRSTSPPRARVSFRATVSGKSQFVDAYPFTVVVDFTVVELRLEKDGVWRVTDNCEYRYPGFATEGSYSNRDPR